VRGSAIVEGSALVRGSAIVEGSALLDGHARVEGADFINFIHGAYKVTAFLELQNPSRGHDGVLSPVLRYGCVRARLSEWTKDFTQQQAYKHRARFADGLTVVKTVRAFFKSLGYEVKR
jgi:hypothetical protein